MIRESLGTSASEVAERLALLPCPEGGWIRDTSPKSGALRSVLRLLTADFEPRWRRPSIPIAFYWHAGAAIEMESFEPGSAPVRTRLGVDDGAEPQWMATPYAWSRLAISSGWSLVGCVSAAGDVELEVEEAPESWTPGAPDPRFSPILERAIRELGAESGSIHLLVGPSVLHLICSKGIPDVVLSMVQRVPVGKGMAGHAVERRGPVTACNIQTDQSGDVRPGARATGLEGAIVVPIFDDHDPTGGAVGALGVANREPRTFTPEETVRLIDLGREVGRARLGRTAARR